MTFNLDNNCGTSREEYAAQGKSNRFIHAQESGKFTAGEAAKILSKRFGQKILAKEIEIFSAEFHHAGMFGTGKAARVFFFDKGQVDAITLEMIEESRLGQWGWILGFEPDYSGSYGRKRWLPIVAEVGQFSSSRIKRLGDKFHALSKDEAVEAKAAIGKRLPAYSSNWREAV